MPHHGRGAYATPGYVADDEMEPPIGEVDSVVPITADIGPHAGRQIAGGQLKAWEAGQIAWEEAALQRDGRLMLPRVEHRVLNR